MLVIVEHGLILNGIAKTLNLLTDFGFGVVVLSESFGYGVAAEISVLDRSWVTVSIFDLPFSLLGLEVLISNVGQFDLLRRHDELLSSVSGLWLRLKKGQNWNGANSPLRRMLDHVLNCNAGSIDTRIKENTGSESRGGSERAIEGCRMSRSSLITEEVRDWCEGASVRLRSLSLLKLLFNEVRNELLGLELREVNFGTTELLIIDDLSLHKIWQRNEE